MFLLNIIQRVLFTKLQIHREACSSNI